LNESGLSIQIVPFAPTAWPSSSAWFRRHADRGLAKDVLDECLREPKRPEGVVAERGLAQVSDESGDRGNLDGVLAENASAVEEYNAGDDKVRKKKRGFLFGEVMRATDKKANPGLVNRCWTSASPSVGIDGTRRSGGESKHETVGFSSHLGVGAAMSIGIGGMIGAGSSRYSASSRRCRDRRCRLVRDRWRRRAARGLSYTKLGQRYRASARPCSSSCKGSATGAQRRTQHLQYIGYVIALASTPEVSPGTPYVSLRQSTVVGRRGVRDRHRRRVTAANFLGARPQAKPRPSSW